METIYDVKKIPKGNIDIQKTSPSFNRGSLDIMMTFTLWGNKNFFEFKAKIIEVKLVKNSDILLGTIIVNEEKRQFRYFTKKSEHLEVVGTLFSVRNYI